MPRRYRPQTELPEDLAAALHALADEHGVTVAALCYHWIITAARLAANSLGHLLPQRPETRAPHGSRGEMRRIRLTIGRAEFGRCQTLIEDAGSSVPAVLRAAGEAYRSAGGDAVMMPWPAKSGLAVAA